MKLKVLKNISSITLLIITLIITVVHIFFRDTKIFNDTINEHIYLFSSYTRVYYQSIFFLVIAGLLGIITSDDLDIENEDNTSIIVYLFIQLYISYEVKRTKLGLSDSDIDGAVPLFMLITFLPTIIYIVRRPLNRIKKIKQDLQNQNDYLMNRIDSLEDKLLKK